MPGKKRDPLTEHFLREELKVTTIPHPNPYVVRVKVEWEPAPYEIITPEKMSQLANEQVAYYQNLMRGEHIHVEAGGPR